MPGAGLDIVTRGWELPGWAVSFYPKDLPRDWSLTFFANEFPAVLVPAHLWMGAGRAKMEAWAGDTHPGFRFYLELPARPAEARLLETVKARLGGKLVGLVGNGKPPPGPLPPCFRWQSGIPNSCRGASAIAWTAPRPHLDPPEARAWLESLALLLNGRPGLVVLDGGTVNADDLHRWLHLAWMLGVT